MVMRAATTIWEGELKTGKGQVAFDSSQAAGPLDVNWPARSENPNGVTSPEELIAAAHSACFSMSFAHALATAGTPATRLTTSAEVHITIGEGIHTIDLKVRGEVPGIDNDAFVAIAEKAKAGCPVSKALAAVNITLDAALE